MPASTTIDVKPLHPEKAEFPIVETELGMVKEVRPLHPSKALDSIVVTELGIIVV